MYQIIYNDRGIPQSILRADGAALPYDPDTKLFDESNFLVQELRRWEAENGVLDLSNKHILSDFELAKLQLQQKIIEIAANKQESLVAAYSSAERDTWDKKLGEAKAYLATDNLDDAPYLQVEAIAMSFATTPEDIAAMTRMLATRIVAKSDELYKASAAIAGRRSRLYGMVAAFTAIEQIQAFDLEAAWN